MEVFRSSLIAALFLVSLCAAASLDTSTRLRGQQPLLPHAATSAYRLVGYFCIVTTEGPCRGEDGAYYSFNDLTKVPSIYTHINIAFAVFDPSGNAFFDITDDYSAELKAGIKTLQSRGVKVLISFGGQDCHWVNINAGNMDVVAKNMVALVTEYGADGIDLDDEEVNAQPDEDKLISLVKTLRASLTPGKLITLTPQDVYIINQPIEGWGGWNTYERVLNETGSMIDWVQIMAYNNGLDALKTYLTWTQGFSNPPVIWSGFDPSRVLLGLLNSQNSGRTGFLNVTTANRLVQTIKSQFRSHPFGGVMFWCTNAEDGRYAASVYDCMTKDSCGDLPTPTPSPSGIHTATSTPTPTHHNESPSATPTTHHMTMTPTPTTYPSGDLCAGKDVGFYCGPTVSQYYYCYPSGHLDFTYKCGPGTFCKQTSPTQVECGYKDGEEFLELFDGQ